MNTNASHSPDVVRQAAENFAESGSELVAFRIGEQEFCIDIMAVREIRGWTQATPVPHAPAYVKGLINLRGTVLSVIDLAVRFGFEPREPSARSVVIVVEVNGQLVGLLVDAVSDILATSLDSVQPTPNVSSELATKFIKGVLAVDSRMISLIQLDGILPNSERAGA
jgi:purine-binding chemotaxis protein CheW